MALSAASIRYFGGATLVASSCVFGDPSLVTSWLFADGGVHAVRVMAMSGINMGTYYMLLGKGVQPRALYSTMTVGRLLTCAVCVYAYARTHDLHWLGLVALEGVGAGATALCLYFQK